MKIAFISILISLTFSIRAQTTSTSTVVDLEIGQKKDYHLVFLGSGRVLKIPNKVSSLKILKKIEMAKKRKLNLDFVFNKKREIISTTKSYVKYTGNHLLSGIIDLNSTDYNSSIIKDMNYLNELFQSSNKNFNAQSQCYHRAHVWSYEWRLNNNIFSSKMWIFFTRKYIRKYNFEWWFHVAPSFNVLINNKSYENVMDIKYARSPLSVNKWTNIFMRDQSKCLLVSNYSDYANYPESNHCFLLKTSMYYYQPIDIEMKEIFNKIKTRWVLNEVKEAYKEAFNHEFH